MSHHLQKITIRLTVDFSTATMESKRQWVNICNMPREKKTRIECSAKLSLKNILRLFQNRNIFSQISAYQPHPLKKLWRIYFKQRKNNFRMQE